MKLICNVKFIPLISILLQIPIIICLNEQFVYGGGFTVYDGSAKVLGLKDGESSVEMNTAECNKRGGVAFFKSGWTKKRCYPREKQAESSQIGDNHKQRVFNIAKEYVKYFGISFSGECNEHNSVLDGLFDEDATTVRCKVNEEDARAYVYVYDVSYLVKNVSIQKIEKPPIMNGVDRRYYKSGELFTECAYKDSQLNGHCKSYYKSGQLKHDTLHADGKHIRSKQYHENGNLKEVAYREHGIFIRKYYDENEQFEKELRF